MIAGVVKAWEKDVTYSGGQSSVTGKSPWQLINMTEILHMYSQTSKINPSQTIRGKGYGRVSQRTKQGIFLGQDTDMQSGTQKRHLECPI